MLYVGFGNQRSSLGFPKVPFSQPGVLSGKLRKSNAQLPIHHVPLSPLLQVFSPYPQPSERHLWTYIEARQQLSGGESPSTLDPPAALRERLSEGLFSQALSLISKREQPLQQEPSEEPSKNPGRVRGWLGIFLISRFDTSRIKI